LTRATPEVRDLARRLLQQEAHGSAVQGQAAFAAQRALERLRLHLGALVGVAGFQALLSRALALARTEADWLGSVRVRADGSLEGFVEAAQERGKDEIAQGGTALLAQLIGLLVAFIGEDLTLRLVRSAWSDVSLKDAGSSVKEIPG
jgi:hypothetical protein